LKIVAKVAANTEPNVQNKALALLQPKLLHLLLNKKAKE
jgi:hypothetical protein